MLYFRLFAHLSSHRLHWGTVHPSEVLYPSPSAAIDHHADDQHLYRHLRQTPVARLSKSVAFLLLGKLALDGRTLAPAIRIGTPHHLRIDTVLFDYDAGALAVGFQAPLARCSLYP